MSYRSLWRRVYCLVLVLGVLLVSTVAAIDFTVVLTDLDGKPITTEAQGKGETVTLGKAAATALLMSFPDEQNLDGAEKVKRFGLAVKIREAKDVALSAEDVALVKKVIAKTYGALIVGRAWPLLDPTSGH